MSLTLPATVDRADWSVAFTVDCRPQPKERPRVARGRVYTPARTTVYEARVAVEARQAMRGSPARAEDGLRVFLIFEQSDHRRADLDNCCKATTDAMNGIVYQDDSQILELRAQMSRGADRDRVTVLVAGPEKR